MADQFLLYERNPAATPGTHVLVIGVGSYPCLLGGDPARLYSQHQNLKQLTSPAPTAKAVAQWFVDHFHNPNRPLATVALLMSDSASAGAAPTMDNIVLAIKQWFQRCDAHKENLPIFYFCGHGLGAGGLLSLLAEDFGSDHLSPLDGALDFNRFHAGMARCAARQQLYFVDACRTDAKLTVSAAGFAGRVPIQPDATGAWSERPIFYSTLKGLAAYGRAERSHFADALLAAFDGTGSDDADGDWRVNTSCLHRALSVHMERKIRAGLASAQIPPADFLTSFDLHWLRNLPRVPVFVRCRPDEASREGELHFAPSGTAPLLRAATEPSQDWELTIEAGLYDFEARFAAGTFKTTRKEDVPVKPPHRVLTIEVAS